MWAGLDETESGSGGVQAGWPEYGHLLGSNDPCGWSRRRIQQGRVLTLHLNAYPLAAARIRPVMYNSDGEVKQEHIDDIKRKFGCLTVLSFEELRQLGENNQVDPVTPEPDDVGCIMHTSGSTKTPKGVLVKYDAVLAAGELLLFSLSDHLRGLVITLVADVSTIVILVLGMRCSLTYLSPTFCSSFSQTHGPLTFLLPTFCSLSSQTHGPLTFLSSTLHSLSSQTNGSLTFLSPTFCSLSSQMHGSSTGAGHLAMVIQRHYPKLSFVIARTIFMHLDRPFLLASLLFSSQQRIHFGVLLRPKGLSCPTGLPGVSVLEAVLFKKANEATGGRLHVRMNGGVQINITKCFLSIAVRPMIPGYGLTERTGMAADCDPSRWSVIFSEIFSLRLR